MIRIPELSAEKFIYELYDSGLTILVSKGVLNPADVVKNYGIGLKMRMGKSLGFIVQTPC